MRAQIMQEAADLFDGLTDIVIGLLFFLNGAKLSTRAMLAGIGHWRLHLLVLLTEISELPWHPVKLISSTIQCS